eukprot:scaffold440_cov277-Ochromonas_danica.AAC.12
MLSLVVENRKRCVMEYIPWNRTPWTFHGIGLINHGTRLSDFSMELSSGLSMESASPAEIDTRSGWLEL